MSSIFQKIHFSSILTVDTKRKSFYLSSDSVSLNYPTCRWAIMIYDASVRSLWQSGDRLFTRSVLGKVAPKQSNHLLFLWTEKVTLAGRSEVFCLAFKTKDFKNCFHIGIILTKHLHLLTGASTGCLQCSWLLEQLCAASHWLPGGEWEERSPRPSPVAERVKAKPRSLPIIWVTLAFGVCPWVCVYGGERKKIKRERVREGETSSICSPPFSLSFLPFPGPPFSPASNQTRITRHLPGHPRNLWLSQHFSIQTI